jgi:cell division protein FtsL
MSEILAEQLTAVANVVLAAFAIVTAVLAGLAFRKQSREVSDQAKMLDLQRRQLAEQEKTSAKQAEILELQATELRESLEERKLSAARRRREQAAHVFLTEKPHPGTTWRSTAATTPSRLR